MKWEGTLVVVRSLVGIAHNLAVHNLAEIEHSLVVERTMAENHKWEPSCCPTKVLLIV